MSTHTILHVASSGRGSASASRSIAEHLIQSLRAAAPNASVVTRDVSRGLPMVDETWIGAAYADPSARTAEQRNRLALSDELVAELQAADTIVIGAPMYNFTIPASLKSWIDQICRARVTFQYTEKSIEGMLKGKKAYVVIPTGGVPLGAPVDYSSTYIRHILGFVGITDVTIVDAARLNFEGDAKIAKAKADASAALSAAA